MPLSSIDHSTNTVGPEIPGGEPFGAAMHGVQSSGEAMAACALDGLQFPSLSAKLGNGTCRATLGLTGVANNAAAEAVAAANLSAGAVSSTAAKLPGVVAAPLKFIRGLLKLG